MNAMQTIRRNQASRAKARARAAFWREAGAWLSLAGLATVALPCAGILGWLVAAGVSM